MVRHRRELASRALTYDAVGRTTTALSAASAPRVFEATRLVGQGDQAWAAASDAVRKWAVKTRSGFDVRDAEGRAVSRAELGRFWLVARLGPLRVHEPIEVVAIVDEPNRVGYAYGTLSGHPVTGEEAFLVDRRADGSVWLTVRSATWPARGWWRTVSALVRVAQHIYRRRYLRSLDYQHR